MGAKTRKRAHCWHDLNVAYTYASYPPINETHEQCCHCGERRLTREVKRAIPGHGPHAPPLWETSFEIVGRVSDSCPGAPTGGQAP